MAKQYIPDDPPTERSQNRQTNHTENIQFFLISIKAPEMPAAAIPIKIKMFMTTMTLCHSLHSSWSVCSKTEQKSPAYMQKYYIGNWTKVNMSGKPICGENGTKYKNRNRFLKTEGEKT